jgi:hypothetical protein
MTIATTRKAAINERARSRVFDRGDAPASSGGMTQLSLRRRLQFAGKPAARLGLHRVLRYADCMNLTALLALESAVIESIWSRCNFGKQHTCFAFRATRPLNVGKMRRSYRLILRHRVSLHAAGALPSSLSPITAKRGRGDEREWPARRSARWSKLTSFGNLSAVIPGRANGSAQSAAR